MMIELKQIQASQALRILAQSLSQREGKKGN